MTTPAQRAADKFIDDNGHNEKLTHVRHNRHLVACITAEYAPLIKQAREAMEAMVKAVEISPVEPSRGVYLAADQLRAALEGLKQNETD